MFYLFIGTQNTTRAVITKAINGKGKLEYRHIYISFSPEEMDEVEVVLSFRKRIDVGNRVLLKFEAKLLKKKLISNAFLFRKLFSTND